MAKREGVFKPTYRYKGERRESRIWHIRYKVNGRRYVESSGSTRQEDAIKLRQQRLAERGRGIARRDLERTTFSELADGIRIDYANNGQKSLDRLERSLRHLEAAYDGWRAVDITEDVIERYKNDRKVEGAANATVNRELACLRRMFRLGRRQKKVAHVPEIEMLTENNARQGFIEEPQFRAMLKALPWHHSAWVEFDYYTGWRVASEVLTRQWKHVDLDFGWVRLEPGETKNGKGRQFPLIPQLRVLLERQLERKREIERERGIVIPWVFFQPNGKPIKSFRKAWRSACERAGVPHLIPHDLRRTAVRNLERAGVPRTTAMALVGHETESIYRRYAIQDEATLKEGAAKLSDFYNEPESRAEPERKVIPLAR